MTNNLIGKILLLKNIKTKDKKIRNFKLLNS